MPNFSSQGRIIQNSWEFLENVFIQIFFLTYDSIWQFLWFTVHTLVHYIWGSDSLGEVTIPLPTLLMRRDYDFASYSAALTVIHNASGIQWLLLKPLEYREIYQHTGQFAHICEYTYIKCCKLHPKPQSSGKGSPWSTNKNESVALCPMPVLWCR